ncbi:B12-binding domain-containing radical SAM protein [Rubellicoccus peritrichatus]|uniref:B12-binding domain-containing radical SAM protein n=1 Tax=Rubellicoccus peritrichatus TaxID=3080537 RepID=A0AAQ3L5D9_9BACT|nr:B12-binding domain-containing radical SAM protein [Puniceicoccus sp. CR14]WOO39296.1 B12-binding domain-containing radical SAM protein [Puniceicoccus sp. CR14]
MNVLLVYPKFPTTYWSFQYALKFLGKKAALPPLGLITVAAILPKEWTLKLVDMNVSRLRKSDLAWADAVMISAMVVQQDSVRDVILRANALGKTVIAGGPAFTCEPDEYPGVDHLILGEAERSLAPFLEDFVRGKAKPRYEAESFPQMCDVPNPRWDLLNIRKYASMSIQFSRGCPFNCDFCNVTALFGHRPRIKTTKQILKELDSIWALGWRSSVFFVDDNFIGNKRFLKRDLLPALVAWQKSHKTGLPFYTEASINMADDPELMEMMSAAGFDTVFIGLETPSEAALTDCNKKQNRGRDLVNDIKKIQRAGMQVQGGFIVGFDSDTHSIFQRQIDFIQKSGVVTAMVGILQAPVGTALHERMSREGRLVGESSGNNTSVSTNIIPKMNLDTLVDGYQSLIKNLYSPSTYYARVKIFLNEFNGPMIRGKVDRHRLRAFLTSIVRLGILGRERFEYWKLLSWVAVRKTHLLPTAISLAIIGFHFRKVSEQICAD